MLANDCFRAWKYTAFRISCCANEATRWGRHHLRNFLRNSKDISVRLTRSDELNAGRKAVRCQTDTPSGAGAFPDAEAASRVSVCYGYGAKTGYERSFPVDPDICGVCLISIDMHLGYGLGADAD